MGFITTISIYNDGCDQIQKYPEEFAKKVYEGCIGAMTRNDKADSFGLGYHANLVTVQKPRHADDVTVYVHLGNTVREMNPYSKETMEIMERNPKYFDEMLRTMERNVKELKEKRKELQAKV